MSAPTAVTNPVLDANDTLKFHFDVSTLMWSIEVYDEYDRCKLLKVFGVGQSIETTIQICVGREILI